MFAVVLGMLVVIGLALTVFGLVAVPALREGRRMLTDQGEARLQRVRAQR